MPLTHFCGCVPLHWSAPFVHEAAHVPAVHTPTHAGPLFCHVPVPSHVCGCWPLHWTAPGTHDPPQAPALQTNGHVPPRAHVPFAPHDSGVVPASPAHPAAPGVQLPVHTPLTHALFVHVVGELHTPVAPHVSMPLLAH